MTVPHDRPSSAERSEDPLPAWPRIATRRGPDLLICRVRFDELRNPRNQRVLTRTVLETPDWVNVVALTPANELVCVRQYRFGSGDVTLEIPGGVVDPGEEHRAAAERELLEETGYRARRWRYLGAVQPNPAFHTNRCHHWLAEGCERSAAQALDAGEDIEVVVLGLDAVRAAIATGAMQHALVQTALARVLDLRVVPIEATPPVDGEVSA